MLSSSSSDYLLDLQSGSDRQVLASRQNAIEPSTIKYLAECFVRADNECIRKWSREGVDDDFSQVKAKIVEDCEKVIIERARYAYLRFCVPSQTQVLMFVSLSNSVNW